MNDDLPTFTFDEMFRPSVDAEEALRRFRVQMFAEQRLVDQIRARQIDPQAFVRIVVSS